MNLLLLTGRGALALGNPRSALRAADRLVESGRVEEATRLAEAVLDLVRPPEGGLASEAEARWVLALRRTRRALRGQAPRRARPSPPTPEALLGVLDAALAALDREGVRPFLAFGTLLGMVREGSFLSGDRDLDLGVFAAEASPEGVAERLDGAGFRIEEGGVRAAQVVAHHPVGVKVDLPFFHADAAHLLTWAEYRGHRVERRRTPFALKRATILEREVWVPDPVETFLSENYGDWRVRSPAHHYLLTSALTDHGHPLVRFAAAREVATRYLAGRGSEARALEAVIRERRGG